MEKTQVAIIGAGPAGLLLGHILHLRGISSVILEAKSRAYCESRIRAGILEQETVDMLRRAGLNGRMDKEGLPHWGVDIAFQGQLHPISIEKYDNGRQVMAWGQTEVVKDLFAAHEANGSQVITEAEVVSFDNITGDQPVVSYQKDGKTHQLACDFIAGCDGFWGVSRHAIPEEKRRAYDLIYPYSWLGILADAPPANEVVIYAHSRDGFALQSMRSATVSRLYIQVDNDDKLENWSDEAIWEALDSRTGVKMNRGPITDRAITPMRSYVSEPMQYGRLFLAGDAAHIVPPTGAKGLNLAVADVSLLSAAFISHYCKGDETPLSLYGERVLRRIWKVERFSWYATRLLHLDRRHSEFELRLQEADLEYLLGSDHAKASFAENYAGLPIDQLPDI